LTKSALAIAINDYPAPYQLRGCINDGNDFLNRMGKSMGYTVSTLYNNRATKVNIINKITSLVNTAVSGDTIVIFYSGHGSQKRDINNDEIDGLDEVLCPFDFFSGQYITDDDLRNIFNRLPTGVTLEVILDCCHSGTGTREFDEGDEFFLKEKFIPGDMMEIGEIREIAVVPELNHVLWGGCRDNQTSGEAMINGAPRGIFSYFLFNEMMKGGTRIDIIQRVEKDIKNLGIAQRPQLEASTAELLDGMFC
jgi:metacaspase-1